MKIDLHIHTSTGSDGTLTVEEVFQEARKRNIDFMSITDHDSLAGQAKATALAGEYGIGYISGVELNVTFQLEPNWSISLDFLGYRFDSGNQQLKRKLELLRKYRETRARRILAKLNIEFDKENIEKFTEEDIREIEVGVDGAFGRPHIADYLVKRGIVSNRQEAFDRYLVRCNVPKFPLSPVEASSLVRNAGGIVVLAHPNDPNGTSLAKISSDLDRQMNFIEKYMLKYIDGIECWHSRHDSKATAGYIGFAREHALLMTGGSDCHQKPILLGTVAVPDYVAEQFELRNDGT
ncbi:MAG: PHP domain-containing protein [Chloroflexi bacterium]|nr:PHP domain-containing protein [Chloroflexota bacterium]